MNLYFNLLDEYVREPDENPSIRIILCSDRNRLNVEYTQRGMHKPIGVAEFRLTNKLPSELMDKLTDPHKLQKIFSKS